MARKVLSVDGMENGEILDTITGIEGTIYRALEDLKVIKGAFAEREYTSVTLNLNKVANTLHARGDKIEKAMNAGALAEEKKKTDAALKVALADPEKAEKIKTLLGF